jgi:ubiquinone/menaquinone biosynthesis C-methylase UbiE
MKLNSIEKTLMNNPVRALLQRRYEAPLMERFGGRTEGLRVLEIGCGRGIGTEIIFERFRAREVHAFDIDLEMVELARKRLASYGPSRLTLYVGDAETIAEADASFDAVFDFGIIHHVPEWKRAIAEVARVLKPGGRFFFEEVTSKALNRWVYRTFLEHPTENRFSAKEFVAELERKGIATGDNWVEWLLGDFVTGVGRRPMAT